MSENLSTKSCLIADHGLFMDLAPRLARDFGEVRLFIPWIAGYPHAAPAYLGTGIDGVERIPTFWDYVDDSDCIIFPDLYMADMAKVCRDVFNKPVWAHFEAEYLELDRWGTRKLQRQELGIDYPDTKHIIGVDRLAEYLKGVKDKWVKISTYRGDGETWHHTTWNTTQVYLNHFRNKVGALANSYEFVVEDNIDGIEIGYDGWTVHGDYPDSCYWGFEMKDRAYIGKFSSYKNMPEPVQEINNKMSSILRKESAVGFCSFEFRYTKDRRALLIDPCMRCGSPPTEATMEGYKNLGEIIWEGAHGRMAQPESLGEYIALAVIRSEFALENWVPLDIPESIYRWVKLHNRAVVDGTTYYVPTNHPVPEIAAVIGIGDSVEEAVDLVKERSKQVDGYGIEIMTEILDTAQEEINKARDYGISF